jgi:hypothetical protein
MNHTQIVRTIIFCRRGYIPLHNSSFIFRSDPLCDALETRSSQNIDENILVSVHPLFRKRDRTSGRGLLEIGDVDETNASREDELENAKNVSQLRNEVIERNDVGIACLIDHDVVREDDAVRAKGWKLHLHPAMGTANPIPGRIPGSGDL